MLCLCHIQQSEINFVFQEVFITTTTITVDKTWFDPLEMSSILAIAKINLDFTRSGTQRECDEKHVFLIMKTCMKLVWMHWAQNERAYAYTITKKSIFIVFIFRSLILIVKVFCKDRRYCVCVVDCHEKQSEWQYLIRFWSQTKVRHAARHTALRCIWIG